MYILDVFIFIIGHGIDGIGLEIHILGLKGQLNIQAWHKAKHYG